MPHHKPQRSWRQDATILERLVEVERRHLAGMSNRAIAAELGVSERRVRVDLERLQEIWLERVGSEVEQLRAQTVAELDDIKRLALEAYQHDREAELAVLYGEGARLVQRDDKGSVQFRGNKAAALQAARQAIMDKAKLLGIVVDKVDQKLVVTAEVKRLAQQFGEDEADILAEAEAILKEARA
jgi:flagellar motor protein MotB